MISKTYTRGGTCSLVEWRDVGMPANSPSIHLRRNKGAKWWIKKILSVLGEKSNFSTAWNLGYPSPLGIRQQSRVLLKSGESGSGPWSLADMICTCILVSLVVGSDIRWLLESPTYSHTFLSSPPFTSSLLFLLYFVPPPISLAFFTAILIICLLRSPLCPRSLVTVKVFTRIPYLGNVLQHRMFGSGEFCFGTGCGIWELKRWFVWARG